MSQGSIIDIAMECLLAGEPGRTAEERHHCRRVEKLCALTARQLGWSSEEISDLRLAALLHHMDRKRIPESALAPGVAAYLSSFSRRNVDHETCSEKHTCRAEQAASILALADAFDRLTTQQRYRRALSNEEALRILRHDATTPFEQTALDAFSQIQSVMTDIPDAAAA